MELLNTNTTSNAQGAIGSTQLSNLVNPTPNNSQKSNAQDKAKKDDSKPGAAAKETKSTPEVPKTEEKPPIVVKPVLNLDATLKILKDLHRESIKRDNLIDRINKLEDFEILLMDDADEIEDNIFAGCKLIIEDNNNRRFVTNTPGLIKMVAEFVKTACYNKLAEIEANIIFPSAA